MKKSAKAAATHVEHLDITEQALSSTAYIELKWQDSTVPTGLKRPIGELEKCVAALAVVGALLINDAANAEDATSNKEVRYTPLTPWFRGGLYVAHDLLIECAHSAFHEIEVSHRQPQGART